MFNESIERNNLTGSRREDLVGTLVVLCERIPIRNTPSCHHLHIFLFVYPRLVCRHFHSILLANISNNYMRTNEVSACVGVTCFVSRYQNTIQQLSFLLHRRPITMLSLLLSSLQHREARKNLTP